MATDSAPLDSKNAPLTCRSGAGMAFPAPLSPAIPFLPASKPPCDPSRAPSDEPQPRPEEAKAVKQWIDSGIVRELSFKPINRNTREEENDIPRIMAVADVSAVPYPINL